MYETDFEKRVQDPARAATPSRPGRVLLGIDAVSVRFGGVRAVDGISLEIAEGELLGLVGPNGSGKSTLLGAISRLTPLHSGTLQLRGERYDTKSPAAAAKLGIARTFQTVRLLPRLSVLENVMLGADSALARSRPSGLARFQRSANHERAVRDAAQEALARVGLSHINKADVRVLPYGTQRRVEIARALARRPEILLLDEPMAGMSQTERDEIGALISELAIQGLAEIVVEHDVTMMVNICPRLVVLDLGKVIADGDPISVVRLGAVQEAYLGGDYRAPA